MAINYEKVPWTTSSYVNPTNMNRLENGVKSACDGVDTINSTMATSTEVLDLKMLGWTVPKELGISNYVSSGVYHQKVGRVCLGDLTWSAGGVSGVFGTTLASAKSGLNAYMNGYTVVATISHESQPNMSIQIRSGGVIYIKNTSYTDATAFRTAMANQQVYLYYELATEVTKNVDGNEEIPTILTQQTQILDRQAKDHLVYSTDLYTGTHGWDVERATTLFTWLNANVPDASNGFIIVKNGYMYSGTYYKLINNYGVIELNTYNQTYCTYILVMSNGTVTVTKK